jgi:hypothetical protein
LEHKTPESNKSVASNFAGAANWRAALSNLNEEPPMPLSINALKDRVTRLEGRKRGKIVSMFYDGTVEARAKYADLVRQQGAANVVVVGWFKKGESSDQWVV